MKGIKKNVKEREEGVKGKREMLYGRSQIKRRKMIKRRTNVL